MTDALAWWRAALAGDKPPVHESPACCGYFKIRDRRGLNKKLAPIKRPFIACAIFIDPDTGEQRAELAGQAIEPERLWPYCAKHPIPYETYTYWHRNEAWPLEAA